MNNIIHIASLANSIQANFLKIETNLPTQNKLNNSTRQKNM